MIYMGTSIVLNRLFVFESFFNDLVNDTFLRIRRNNGYDVFKFNGQDEQYNIGETINPIESNFESVYEVNLDSSADESKYVDSPGPRYRYRDRLYDRNQSHDQL